MIFSFGSGSGFPSMKVNFHCNKETTYLHLEIPPFSTYIISLGGKEKTPPFPNL
jgi:hypothetical protein